MPAGFLIVKVENGGHAWELIHDIFGVDSFVVGEELLTIYGDDEDTWWHPLAWTLTEQAFLRRFFGGGISQPSAKENRMVTTTELATKVIHGAAAAVGLVDSEAAVKAAKAREVNRKVFSQLDARTVAMQTASRELEATNQKIARGELHVGAARAFEQDFAHAARLFRACQAARTALFDGAPSGLRIRYFRKKREVVSVQTRVNLLVRQQLPDLKRELATLEEKAALAIEMQAKFSGHKDAQTRFQLEEELRLAVGDVSRLKIDLEGLRLELSAAQEKLPALESELREITAAMLAA